MPGSAPPSESTPRTVPVTTLRKRDIMTQMYAEKDTSIYDMFKDVFSERPTRADQKLTWRTKLRGLLNKLEPEDQKLARIHVGDQVWSKITAQHVDRIDFFNDEYNDTTKPRRQWVEDLRYGVSLMTPSEVIQTRAQTRPEIWSELVFPGIRAVNGRTLIGETVGHALISEWDLFPTPRADSCDRCREHHLHCEVPHAVATSCRECLISGQECASTLGKRKRADDDSPSHPSKRIETQSSTKRRDVTLDDVVALLPLQEVLSLFSNDEKRLADETAWVKGLMQLLLDMDEKQQASAREQIGPHVWAKIVYQTLPLNTNGPYPFSEGKLYGTTPIVDWDLVPVPSPTPCAHCVKRKTSCLLTNANAQLCRACIFTRRACDLKRPQAERRSMRQAGLESDFQFDGIRQHMNTDIEIPAGAANVVAFYKDTKARENNSKWITDLRAMLRDMDDATLNSLQDVITPEHWTDLVFAGIKESFPQAKLDNNRTYVTDWDMFPTNRSMTCHNCVEKGVDCQKRRRYNTGVGRPRCRLCALLGKKCLPADEPRPPRQLEDTSVENFLAVYHDKTKVQRLPDSEWIEELREWAVKLDVQAQAKIKDGVTRGHWVQMVHLGLPGRNSVKLNSTVIYGKRSVYDWDLVPTVALKACDACTKRKTTCEYIAVGKEKRPCRSCFLEKQDDECWESSVKPASKPKSQSTVKAQSSDKATPVDALSVSSGLLPTEESTRPTSTAHFALPESSSTHQLSQVLGKNNLLTRYTDLYNTPPVKESQKKAWYTSLRDLVPKMSERDQAEAKAIVSMNDWSEMVALSIDDHAPLVGTKIAQTNIKTWDLIPTEREEKCASCAPRGLPCHYPIKGSNRTTKCRRCKLAHRMCPGPPKRKLVSTKSDRNEETGEDEDGEEDEELTSSPSEDDDPPPPPPQSRRLVTMARRSNYGWRPRAVQPHVTSSPSSERRMTRTASGAKGPLVALPMDPRKRLPTGELPPKTPVKQGEKGKEVAVDVTELEKENTQPNTLEDDAVFTSTPFAPSTSAVPNATTSRVGTPPNQIPSTSTQAMAPAPRTESSPSREEFSQYRLPTPSPQQANHQSLPPLSQSASSLSTSGPPLSQSASSLSTSGPPPIQPLPSFSGSTVVSPHSQAMDVDDSSFRVPDPPQWHSRPSSGQSIAPERQPSLFSERYMSPIASMAESRMLDRLERELDRKERDLERKEREIEKLHAAKDNWEVRERGLMDENRRLKEEGEALKRRVKELEDLQDGARREEDSLRDRLKVFLQLKE